MAATGDKNFLIGGCIGMAVVAGIAAASIAAPLGWPAFLLLFGICAVGIIGGIALMVMRPAIQEGQSKAEADLEGLRHLVAGMETPAVLMQKGTGIAASPSYFALAGLEPDRAIPELVQIFPPSSTGSSAALFRLYRAAADDKVKAEQIKRGDEEWTVYVKPLPGETTLWQFVASDGAKPQAVSALSGAPVGLFVMDRQGKILAQNQTLKSWIGSKEDIPSIGELITEPAVLMSGNPHAGLHTQFETQISTRQQGAVPVMVFGTWAEDGHGELTLRAAVYNRGRLQVRPPAVKETERDEQLAEDVRAAVAEAGGSAYGELAMAAPVGIIQLDSRNLSTARVLNVNPAAMDMTGGRAKSGIAFTDIFVSGAERPDFFAEGFQIGRAVTDTKLAGGKTGVSVYFSKLGESECAAYLVNVTARKELEQQLAQSQKMQAIGLLAGGVAHDFNNLLQAIRLNTDELLGRHPVGDPSYPELQKINQTVARAAGLVKKLLAFSRKQTLRTRLLDVTDVLSDLSILLKQVMVERVKVEMKHGRDLPMIRADANQLETVLMNLAVNARDAMPDNHKGVVQLSTARVPIDELRSRGLDPVQEGDYVRIRVADNGSGMDEETVSKIFEPFFTTKEQGKGTGLGLATVYGIVQQSGGFITVTSKVGQGTTFDIYLPEAFRDARDETPAPVKDKPEPKPANLAGDGRILFVEDEASVRTIAAKTLRKRGYEVTEAGDGDEALTILMDNPGKFDLMISDVVMPGMDGPTLLEEGREYLGDARIIFISGYAEEEFSDILSRETDVSFLSKPFTLPQLAEKVKSEIGSGS